MPTSQNYLSDENMDGEKINIAVATEGEDESDNESGKNAGEADSMLPVEDEDEDEAIDFLSKPVGKNTVKPSVITSPAPEKANNPFWTSESFAFEDPTPEIKHSIFGNAIPAAKTSLFASPTPAKAKHPFWTSEGLTFGDPASEIKHSIFGSAAPAAKTSIFASPAPEKANNPFQTSESFAFEDPTPEIKHSIFGNAIPIAKPSFFGSTTPNNPFQTSKSSAFEDPAPEIKRSIFGSSLAPAAKPSIFGSPAPVLKKTQPHVRKRLEFIPKPHDPAETIRVPRIKKPQSLFSTLLKPGNEPKRLYQSPFDAGEDKVKGDSDSESVSSEPEEPERSKEFLADLTKVYDTLGKWAVSPRNIVMSPSNIDVADEKLNDIDIAVYDIMESLSAE